MTEFERNLGQRWFEEVWNQGRREAVAEMLAPDAVIHDGASEAVGHKGFYDFFDRMNAAFSELHVSVEDTIAEGDKVCVRWRCTAKHSGGGLGIPPTGAAIHVTGVTIVRVAGGKLVEAWQNWDMLGMMQQINAFPKPGLAKSATYIGGE
jgi:steroid delta-isomerase-like uncharacterized protein